MDAVNLISLFGIMLVLAAVPSTSVGLVVARSATHGLRSGLAAAAGIAAGDLVFIALAILGMTALAELLGSVFAVVRLLAGGYLIWMGIGLLRSLSAAGLPDAGTTRPGTATSFAAGFLLTLGDVKAIVFYASLFPAFVDLTRITLTSGLVIAGVTVIAVGGVKAVYAVCARQILGRVRNHRIQRAGRATAGGLMVGAGAYLIVKG
jgi:threonine/homoserine/homoserine lactone efflux protein